MEMNLHKMEKHILCLSDEMLVHICTFLTGEDLIFLSSSCQRFNNVLCERKLIRNLNLRAAYSLTSSTIEVFLRPVVRRNHIHTLSLTSCYWLNSSDILWAVMRLSNLKCLRVDDTKLNFGHLGCILKTMKSIECLSWSFHMTTRNTIKSVEKLSEHLFNLKSLDIQIKGFGSLLLPTLLRRCHLLENLKVTTYKYTEVPWDRTDYYDTPTEVHFPKLKSLIVNIPDNTHPAMYFFLENILKDCINRNWNCFWLDTRTDITDDIAQEDSSSFINRNLKELYALSMELVEEDVLELMTSNTLKVFKFGSLKYNDMFHLPMKNSSVTHLLWRSKSMPISLPDGLEHLSISCCNMRSDMPDRSAISYDKLPSLYRLSVPACLFLSGTIGSNAVHEVRISQKKSDRQSHLTNEIGTTDCFLKLFTEIAPNVQELEIKCQPKCNKNCALELRSLTLVSKWLHLESLFLENILVIESSDVATVCTNCPKLKRLGLKNVGLIEGMNYWSVIAQCINALVDLEDFRFEHNRIEKLETIFDALSKHSKLRRVSIICERGAIPKSLTVFFNLLDKCPLLVFLFVRASSITQIMEKKFQRELKAKYLNKRQSLWATIEGTDKNSFWDIIPSVHCYEMIYDPAQLTVMPNMKE